jgi:hypothetical protein
MSEPPGHSASPEMQTDAGANTSLSGIRYAIDPDGMISLVIHGWPREVFRQ